ncbi:MAG: M48 family metallopeptidase, partial [Muribaculaceae bacterium]
WNEYGQLEVTLPPGSTKDQIMQMLDKNHEQIIALREKIESAPARFHEGQVIPCLCHHLEIRRKPIHSHYYDFGFDPDAECFFVAVPLRCDIASRSAERTIISCMKTVAQRFAYAFIIPLAEQVAQEKGCTVREFEIGRGLKKLGHCTRDRVISLSGNLLYYPEELVRYVICHELAHLSEMNHSAAFHSECNRLCGGREAELEQKLRNFAKQLPL